MNRFNRNPIYLDTLLLLLLLRLRLRLELCFFGLLLLIFLRDGTDDLDLDGDLDSERGFDPEREEVDLERDLAGDRREDLAFGDLLLLLLLLRL